MSAPDQRLAALERQDDPEARAEALRLRVRAGELPAYTAVRVVTCDDCGGHGWLPGPAAMGSHCFPCAGKGGRSADPQDALRLLAFCGDVGARLLADDWARDALPPREIEVWVRVLGRLAHKLPPKRVESADRNWVEDGSGWVIRPVEFSVIHDTPAERWLIVVAALAVAGHMWPHTEQTRALYAARDACAAWVEEPTPEREAAWNGCYGPFWIPWPNADPTDALLAAAEVLGPARVREIASRAVAGAVMGRAL